MSKENQQTVSDAAVQLPKGKKKLVNFGDIMLCVSIACYGLVFSTLCSNILQGADPVNGLSYVSLFSILSSIGITIMTPIGGKLGDMLGRKKVLMVAGTICVIAGAAIAFVKSIPAILVLRCIVGFCQGAFVPSPYIFAGMVNDKKDVPKAMGMLAMALSIGGFGGSIVAGILTDAGLLTVAIIFPAIFLIAGLVCIGIGFPDMPGTGSANLDIPGIAALVVSLVCILIPLNFGPTWGWANPLTLGLLVVGIIFVVVLVKVEQKAASPILPLKLFKNSNYLAVLVIGGLYYAYRGAMDVYAPIGAQYIFVGGATMAGMLQFPRTIVTMVLPGICGAWVGKKSGNMGKAIALAGILSAVPMLIMGFAAPTASILLVYFVPLTITGLAESFRGVSVMSAAQAQLSLEDIGIGTSIVNFANSLVASIVAAVYGLVYNTATAADVNNVDLITKGCNHVFFTAGIITMVGVVLTFTWLMPLLKKQAEQKAAA